MPPQISLQVKVDGPQTTIAEIKQDLVKTKVEAKAVGEELSKALGGPAIKDAAGRFQATSVALGGLGTKVREAAASSDQFAARMRAAALHTELLGKQLSPLAAGFAKLSEQLKREQEMLDRIHKPMKDLEGDLAAVEALHKRGAISAGQYADELARIGKSNGLTGTQHGAGAVSLPGMPDPKAALGGAGAATEGIMGLAGGLASIAGPAALAGAALNALSEEFDHWKQRTKDTNDATNAILKFHDSIDEATAAMGEQEQLSKDLHENIKDTAKAYSEVREATDGLYLSSKQQVDITRNLTAALVNDGGSIGDVAGIMGKLQYAQDAGTMSARDLKSIWIQSDDVANMFADTLGITYKELMAMAKEEKIGATEIEKMTVGLGDGHKAMDKYNQRLLNLDEIMDKFHVSFFEGLQIMKEAHEPYQAVADTFLDYSEKADLAEEKTRALMESTKKMIQTAYEMSLAADSFRKVGTFLGHMADASAKVDSLKTPLEKYREEVKKFTEDAKASGMAADEMNKALSRMHPPEWVDYYKEQLDAIKKPEMEWNGRLHALDSLLSNGAITMKEYEKALRGIVEAQKEVSMRSLILAASLGDADTKASIARGAHGQGLAQGSQFGRDFDAIDRGAYQTSDEAMRMHDQAVDSKVGDLEYNKSSQADAPDLEKDLAAHEKIVEAEKQHAFLTSKWRKELDGTALSVADVVGHLQPVTDMLVEAAQTGKLEWRNMTDAMIQDLQRVAAEKLVLGLVNMISGGGPIPGHATGTQYTVGGSGGTDSQVQAFRATPGERVTVETQAQQAQNDAAKSGGGGGGAPIVINNHVDVESRALAALGTADGMKLIINAMRSNPRAVRNILSR